MLKAINVYREYTGTAIQTEKVGSIVYDDSENVEPEKLIKDKYEYNNWNAYTEVDLDDVLLKDLTISEFRMVLRKLLIEMEGDII